MKRIISVLLIVLFCFSLCSCEAILNKAKSAVTGAEISTPPADYLTTLSNSQFEYELYKDYVKVIKYLGEETVVEIPSEIDNTPVKVIGELCFYDIEADVTNVVIPASVDTIESKAFYLATTLVEITIPDTVTKIGENAFAWCSVLETVKIGKGITEIPDYCFNSCPKLTTVEISETVKRIGLRAFSYCNSLAEMTISENIEEIENLAFVNCPALEYVVIENQQIVLGKSVFNGSDKVIIVSAENSNAYVYCTENYHLWTSDKTVEAVYLCEPESDMSDVSGEVSEIN